MFSERAGHHIIEELWYFLRASLVALHGQYPGQARKRPATHTPANWESGRRTLDAGLGLGIFPENMEKYGL